MAELKTPTSPLVLSKPQTHSARVALPHARAGSRLWWGLGGLGGVAIAAALWWLAPWRAWLTPTVSAPPPPRDTVHVSQAPPTAVPTDTTSGRGAPVPAPTHVARPPSRARRDRKSTRLNSSHSQISYAVFCLKKKNHIQEHRNPQPSPSTSG